jgi:16S rRNA (adenine(1408)-N(1))-methyltransferase
MAETSRRAARAPRKGGLPNLLFAVAAAERPPTELCGRVDEVTVLFPWGSLLRGVLGVEPAAAAGIAALLAPGGRIRALVSIMDRDSAAADLRPLTEADRTALADRWARLGMSLAAFEHATAEEIAASGSTWARRLGRERPVWRVDLCRSGCLDPRG